MFCSESVGQPQVQGYRRGGCLCMTSRWSPSVNLQVLRMGGCINHFIQGSSFHLTERSSSFYKGLVGAQAGLPLVATEHSMFGAGTLVTWEPFFVQLGSREARPTATRFGPRPRQARLLGRHRYEKQMLIPVHSPASRFAWRQVSHLDLETIARRD